MSDLLNILKINKKIADKPQIRSFSQPTSEPRLGKKAHDHARSNSICPCQILCSGKASTLFFNNLSGADVGTKNADKKSS
jgi:hypothetical protein